MTILKKVLLGTFCLCMIGTLPLAQAQNDQGRDDFSPKMHTGQRTQEIYSQLNLTDDQKKQLESNKQDHRAKMERDRQEMRASKEAMQEELMKPQLDMSRVNELHSKIKALMSSMEDDKLTSILAVRAILTPEQFTKFVNLMHRHK